MRTDPETVRFGGLRLHTFECEPLGKEPTPVGSNVIAVDFRRHDPSPLARGWRTLEHLTADARTALDSAADRAAGPMLLFGNSLGAMVGVLTAFPDEWVNALIGVNGRAHAADLLATGPRQVLDGLLKLIEPVAPIPIDVDHLPTASPVGR